MADFGGEVRTAIRELSWGECCSRKHGRGSVAGQAGNGPITVIYEHRACGSPLAVTAPPPPSLGSGSPPAAATGFFSQSSS